MANREHDPSLNWIFFAAQAKQTSIRRAVAERLAKTDHVVIVDQPISIIRERRSPPLRERFVPLSGTSASYRYRPLHYPEGLPVTKRFFKMLNRVLLRKELEQLLPRNGKRIACYDSPAQYPFANRLGEHLSLYLAIDDRTLTVTGKAIKGELEAEKQLLAKVTAVICVSEYLSGVIGSRMQPGRQIPVRVLPNGYDETLFDFRRSYPEPEVLRNISRPRVLVAGHVSERIDWDGIVQTLRLRPQWTWVFVGPADSGMPERIRQLSNEAPSVGKSRHSPNLIWHDRAPLEHIPAFITHSDACAVPYRLNEFTCASSPLKAIEYLAMGTPVLSTRVPSLEHYGDVILWVDEGDAASYARALDNCTGMETKSSRYEARRNAVKEDSWRVRVNQFREIVLHGNV